MAPGACAPAGSGKGVRGSAGHSERSLLVVAALDDVGEAHPGALRPGSRSPGRSRAAGRCGPASTWSTASTVGWVLARTACRSYVKRDPRPGCRSGPDAAPRTGTSTPTLGRWSTTTSRSSAASPTAEAGAFTVAARPRTVAPELPATQQPVVARHPHAATSTSTTPSTTTAAWPTPSSTPTSARRPPPGSGCGPTPSSPRPASRSPQ